MLNKIFYTKWFLGLLFLLYCSCSNKREQLYAENLNQVISQNYTIEELKIVEKNLDSLRNLYDHQTTEIDIIKLVLEGRLIAKQYDSLNTKSHLKFANALHLLRSSKDPSLKIWVNTVIGFYYYSYNNYEKALPYFLQSSKLIDELPNEKLLQGPEVLKINAYFYGTVEDNIKNETYLIRALEITPTESEDYATLLNALGNYYIKFDDLAKGKMYLIKALVYAKANNDKLRYAKILGDLGILYQKQKKYNVAIKNLMEDITISDKVGNDRNTTYARIQLGRVYLELNDYAKAKEVLLNAKAYAEQKSYLKIYELEIYKLLLDIVKIENHDANELAYRRHIERIEDEIEWNESQQAITNINWKIQRENFNYKIESERLKAEKEALKNKIAFVFLILLVLVIIFVIQQNRRKRKVQYEAYRNKLLKIEVDKFKSLENLEKKDKTLQNYKQYLKERNQQIEELEQILKTYHTSKNIYIAEHQGNLEELLHSHLMTDENWSKFKETFIQEMPDYYYYLKENFPNLTESNLRIIFLQKLGLSNVETAHLLGVSVEAIKKAKQRLKKKYPDNYENIYHYTKP